MNFIYAVEQSLDNYKFNLLKNKQTFISQMKNCELNVRTIDEGSIDEKSGMNFSEYIAILSGDTTLLEKTKLEKKIAVMESLKTAHFREIVRVRYQVESLEKENARVSESLKALTADRAVYHRLRQTGKDGSKLNPIQLNELQSADAKVIGDYLIRQYKTWHPAGNAENPKKLGELYGFNLYIRNEGKIGRLDDKSRMTIYNSLYAERAGGMVKYVFNSGAPNTDNPKLAARYFLNAIDKVDGQVEKYAKELQENGEQLPQLRAMLDKPFENEKELRQMKTALASLEREIAVKIQAKQEAERQQHNEQMELPAADEKNKAGITNGQHGNTQQEKPAKPDNRIADIAVRGQALTVQAGEILKKAKGVRI